MASLFKHLSHLVPIYKIASIALCPPPPLVIVLDPPPSPPLTVHGEWLWGILDEFGPLLVCSELPEDLAFGQTTSTQEEGLCEFVLIEVLLLLLLDGRSFFLRVISFGICVVKVRVGRGSQEGLEGRGRGSFPVI